MKFILVLFSIILFHASAQAQLAKSNNVLKILETTQEIYKLSTLHRDVDQKHIRRMVDNVVSKLNSLDQLATFAVITWNIAYPQNAGDESIDLWFNEACWIALEIIAQNKTSVGREVLKEITHRIKLDGGAKLIFDNLVRQQNDLPPNW